MWSYFSEKPLHCNLRNGNSLQLPLAKSYRFEINYLRFRRSILWNNLPFSVKNSETITEFKNKLKILGNIDCTCVVCQWKCFEFFICVFPIFLQYSYVKIVHCNYFLYSVDQKYISIDQKYKSI